MTYIDFLEGFIFGEAIMLLVAGYLLLNGISLIKRSGQLLDEQTAALKLANEIITDLKTVVVDQENRLLNQDLLLREQGIHRVTDVNALPPEAQAILREGLLRTLEALRKNDN